MCLCVFERIDIDDTIDDNLHFYRCFMKLLLPNGCVTVMSSLCFFSLAHFLILGRSHAVHSVNKLLLAIWYPAWQWCNSITRQQLQFNQHKTYTDTHSYKVSWKSTEKVITKLWFYGCINHFPLLGCFAPNRSIFFSLCFELPKSRAECIEMVEHKKCAISKHEYHLNGAKLLGHRHIEIKSDFFSFAYNFFLQRARSSHWFM